MTQVYIDVPRPLGLRVTQFSLLVQAASMGQVESWRLSDALGLDKMAFSAQLPPAGHGGG